MSLLGSRNFCFPFSHGQVSQLIQVMREQIRKRKVKALMQATTMTVIMDDKEDHRVILYRSDIPASEGGEGLLTVLKTGEKSVVDYEDDYCWRDWPHLYMVTWMLLFWSTFAQSSGSGRPMASLPR